MAMPASGAKEADLERNVLTALESVPLDAIRRFSMRLLRFVDPTTRDSMGNRQHRLRSNIEVIECFQRP
ncbi:hypothetical protein K503DRAFT_801564 [Rhizopogon vinicolor AM-OR11-026]|uniref:Uncharacterized protein n=1 Tax=Rhizopogon vinicolor AM-OR11-026 TaxID=1314800 RepID=A0A1B7MWN3_9AGAM|nr:hypothetical protein K503DRAFT_801564 [Rhizopogon vinicolor AM-OR11-026]